MAASVVAEGKDKDKAKKDPKPSKAAQKDKAPHKDKANHKDKAQAVHKDKGKGTHKDKAQGTAQNSGKGSSTQSVASTNPANKLNAATRKDPAFHEAQKKSNAQLVHAFHVLQSTKLLLEKADHDYGGNRAAAVQSIGAAQARLRNALGDYGKNMPPAPPGNVKGGNESQKTSNAQLRHAIKTVSSTITQLQNANHDYFGQRAAAVRDLEGTLQQLRAALKYAK